MGSVAKGFGITLGVLLAIVVFCIGSCVLSVGGVGLLINSGMEEARKESEEYSKFVQIKNFIVEREKNDEVVVRGTIYNSGTKTVSSVEFDFYFLDDYGSKIDQETVYVLHEISFTEDTDPIRPARARDFALRLQDASPSGWRGKYSFSEARVSLKS